MASGQARTGLWALLAVFPLALWLAEGRWPVVLLALIGAGGATLAVQHTFAHGTKVGSLTIDPPYATPTPEGGA